mmetsp:Transcript_21832/g.70509  ORF Transcript_21832/g.70509 Transcript_21832/m.70509 type:complete len:410 (-) Transcript_21832:126-1355(-)
MATASSEGEGLPSFSTRDRMDKTADSERDSDCIWSSGITSKCAIPMRRHCLSASSALTRLLRAPGESLWRLGSGPLRRCIACATIGSMSTSTVESSPPACFLWTYSFKSPPMRKSSPSSGTLLRERTRDGCREREAGVPSPTPRRSGSTCAEYCSESLRLSYRSRSDREMESSLVSLARLCRSTRLPAAAEGPSASAAAISSEVLAAAAATSATPGPDPGVCRSEFSTSSSLSCSSASPSEVAECCCGLRAIFARRGCLGAAAGAAASLPLGPPLPSALFVVSLMCEPNLRFKVELNRFLTALSERPGSSRAITAHAVPNRACMSRITLSSSAENGSLLSEGSSVLNHLRRHDRAVRPGICAASVAQLQAPVSETSLMRRSSSAGVQRSSLRSRLESAIWRRERRFERS